MNIVNVTPKLMRLLMDLNDTGLVPSAVMVLHCHLTDSLILTKRSELLRNHPGEVCFPGGIWEPMDISLYATALRELEEELGIGADRVVLIRELPIERTLLGAVIHPFLASIESIEPYKLNSDEVSELLSVPMSLVINPENYRELAISRYGKQFKSLEFNAGEEFVWGATARIMRHLAS